MAQSGFLGDEVIKRWVRKYEFEVVANEIGHKSWGTACSSGPRTRWPRRTRAAAAGRWRGVFVFILANCSRSRTPWGLDSSMIESDLLIAEKEALINEHGLK